MNLKELLEKINATDLNLPEPSVKSKRFLEWQKKPKAKEWFAEHGNQLYVITLVKKDKLYHVFSMESPFTAIGRFDTLREAMNFCQRDFEEYSFHPE